MTDMLYYSYEGNFLMECDAEITQCVVIEDEKKEESDSSAPQKLQIALDRTVLHAQGGGQPTDIGSIQLVGKEDDSSKIQVTKVLLDRASKVATHSATLDAGAPLPQVGDKVQVNVDIPNRQILSECHTAGHVVDAAMAKVGLLPGMETSKAYHFLEGPYVEYKGNIPAEERAATLTKLQGAFQELLEEDIATDIQVLPPAEAQAACDRIQENYFNLAAFGDGDEPIRLVTVAGWTCPCGGTHVKSTGPLKNRKWGVTGIKYKKGIVKIKYNQDWETKK